MPHPDRVSRYPIPQIGRFALIIGAMKSGTTSLFEYLGSHPAIAPCSVKEPHFFSDEDRHARGMNAYRALWDEWDEAVHRIALEASPGYTTGPKTRETARRIHNADGEFRCIYIMRDPLDRIASHLSHTATERGGADRVDDAAFEWALDVSRYASQLDVYREEVPRDAILPLVQEAMIDDPATVVDRAVSFLGLEPTRLNPSVFERAYNTRTDWAAGVAATRFLGSPKAVERVRRWVPDPLLRWARTVVGRRSLHTVELSPEQRARALAELHPEVARIRSEWGVDVSPWDRELLDSQPSEEA